MSDTYIVKFEVQLTLSSQDGGAIQSTVDDIESTVDDAIKDDSMITAIKNSDKLSTAGLLASWSLTEGSFTEAEPATTDAPSAMPSKSPSTYPTTAPTLAPTGCNAGDYLSGGECRACPLDWMSEADAVECERCPDGEISTGDQTKCTACKHGQYEDLHAPNECKPCAIDHFSDCDTFSHRNGTACDVCPGGWVSNEGKTSCDACQSGKYEKNAGSCKACPSGWAQPANGQATCLEVSSMSALCFPGKYLSGGGDCISCPEDYASSGGLQSSCEKCENGAISSTSKNECMDCQKGKYEADDGFSTCKSCPGGWAQPREGATDCVLCPPRQRSDKGSSMCEPCDDVSVVDRNECEMCTTGTYAAYAVPGEECESCRSDAERLSTVGAKCPAGQLELANGVWHRSALAPGDPWDGGRYGNGISVTKCLTPEACQAWSNGTENTCHGLCDGTSPCVLKVAKKNLVDPAQSDRSHGFGASFGFKCGAGHTGALCAVCEGDHFMAANGTCLACDDDRNTVAAATALGLGAVIAVLLAALLWVARKNAELWKPIIRDAWRSVRRSSSAGGDGDGDGDGEGGRARRSSSRRLSSFIAGAKERAILASRFLVEQQKKHGKHSTNVIVVEPVRIFFGFGQARGRVWVGEEGYHWASPGTPPPPMAA